MEPLIGGQSPECQARRPYGWSSLASVRDAGFTFGQWETGTGAYKRRLGGQRPPSPVSPDLARDQGREAFYPPGPPDRTRFRRPSPRVSVGVEEQKGGRRSVPSAPILS